VKGYAVPKIVDHAERREAVAEAVLAVAARSGLSNATLREIAREAGCSTGTLSHYFRDKHELLLFAFRLAMDRGVTRQPQPGDPRPHLAQLRDFLAGVLPINQEGRASCAIFLEFASWSLSSGDIAQLLREQHHRSCRKMAALLQAAALAGEIDPPSDFDRLAEIIIAFVVGLAREALTDPEWYTSERQMAVVDDVLARLARRPVAEDRQRLGTAAK
jgi:AcrR family transcriptional regulator